MSTITQLINKLGELVNEPKVRAPDYIETYVRLPDMRAYTEQELRWMAEAQLEDER